MAASINLFKSKIFLKIVKTLTADFSFHGLVFTIIAMGGGLGSEVSYQYGSSRKF